MNRKRAEWAVRAVQAFQIITGSDREDAISDLHCDPMHLADEEEIRFALRSLCSSSESRGASGDTNVMLSPGLLRRFRTLSGVGRGYG